MAATAIAMLAVPVGAVAAPTPITQTGQVRISGGDRYETAVAVSKKTFTAPNRVVFIASGEDCPDALAGGPAAAKLGAPILLVRKDGLPTEVSNDCPGSGPRRSTSLAGQVVSDTVSADILKVVTAPSSSTSPPEVTRIFGADRYATAADAAKLVGASPTVYSASGEGFADALAGGAAAAKQAAPILLTLTGALPAATVGALKSIDPTEVVVLGGTGAVSSAAIDQVRATLPEADLTVYAGADRYETAAMLAKALWPSGADVVFYAPGLMFPDALGGTPAAKVNHAPILLTKDTCTPAATANVVDTLDPATQVALGGVAVTYLGSNVCGQSLPTPGPPMTPGPPPTK